MKTVIRCPYRFVWSWNLTCMFFHVNKRSQSGKYKKYANNKQECGIKILIPRQPVKSDVEFLKFTFSTLKSMLKTCSQFFHGSIPSNWSSKGHYKGFLIFLARPACIDTCILGLGTWMDIPLLSFGPLVMLSIGPYKALDLKELLPQISLTANLCYCDGCMEFVAHNTNGWTGPSLLCSLWALNPLDA